MKNLLTLALGVCLAANSFGQISHPGQPQGLKKIEQVKSIAPTLHLSLAPNILASAKAEDAVTDKHKDIPWRFGIEIPQAIDLLKEGVRTETKDGFIYQMVLESKGAKSININYSEFDIPQGAQFFVYGLNTSVYLGAFTHENVKADKKFATSFVFDEAVVLEYFVPNSSKWKGNIRIESVVHGYRVKSIEKDFGDSGSCNNNMACFPEWQEEGNAVALLTTSNNTRFCSGSLLNNVREDKTPYFLTANHCGPASNNIFIFNYQSPNCSPNTDGNTQNSVVGCTVRAQNSPSDFALVELSSSIPETYEVTYLGWSAQNVAPTSAVGIHHPSGDTKKICFDDDPLIDDPDYNGDHWKVLDWNSGTTEGGSSGSPLFDQNRRVVGQLHGGWAACGNDEYDTYGAFFYSFDNSPNANQQLKVWLDPDNTGTRVLNSLGNFTPSLDNDARLVAVNQVGDFICGNSISPEILIRNTGINAITNIQLNYQVQGGTPESFTWTGNLGSGEYETLALDPISLSGTGGNSSLDVSIDIVNGFEDDDSTNNDANASFFVNPEPQDLQLIIQFDDFPSENSWSIIDNQTNQVIPSGNSGAPQELVVIPLCTYEGCYTLTFTDDFGDGICCDYGNGYVALVGEGDTIYKNSNFSGDEFTHSFCTDNLGQEELSVQSFALYPNPSEGMVYLDANLIQAGSQFSVSDMSGRLVYQASAQAQMDLSHLGEGMYLVELRTQDEIFRQQLIIH